METDKACERTRVATLPPTRPRLTPLPFLALLTCAMSIAFSNTPQWSHWNSISPYTAFQTGSSSSGTDGMGGRSESGRSELP